MPASREMAAAHQVSLAHVLRDVQYDIDCGDSVFAPALVKLLAWMIAIGRRRGELKDSTLKQHRIKADCRLSWLLRRRRPIRPDAARKRRERPGEPSSSSSSRTGATAPPTTLPSAISALRRHGGRSLATSDPGRPQRPCRLQVHHQHCPNPRLSRLQRHRRLVLRDCPLGPP